MKTYQEWTKPQNNWMSGINQLELFIKDGQSMIRIQFKRSIMKRKFEKVKCLRPRFLVWKEMKMFAQ
jgi:hypothetical protein